MKDTNTRGGSFWQDSWSCKGESSPHASMHGPSGGSSDVYEQDEMASWLQLEDPNYCTQTFGEVNRASSSIQSVRDGRRQQSIVSAGVEKQGAMDADAALALAAGRAAGLLPQTGVEVFDRPRTVCQPSTKIRPSVSTWHHESTSVMPPPLRPLVSSQFPVCVARTRCLDTDSAATEAMRTSGKFQESSSFESERSTLDCKSPRQIVRSEPAAEARTAVSLRTNYSSGWESEKIKQATDSFTSSMCGSRSEKSEREHKRKEKEVEDTAGCQGKEESAEKKKPPKSSKRSRAAEVHNLSERKRRDRINERMRALQELIPNSNKTDKASMLDEAIEYLKMLQHQLQMMSMRTGMMSSLAIPHMQMPPVPPGYGGMGMGVRLVDVSAHPLLPPHPGLSIPASVVTTLAGATQFPPGLNPEMYNAHLLSQQQQHQDYQCQHQKQEEN